MSVQFVTTGTPLIRDTSYLDPVFKPFYDSHERVEITWRPGFERHIAYGTRPGVEGRIARGYIGRSRGSRPVYLLLYNSRSSVGEPIRASEVASIRGMGYTYFHEKLRPARTSTGRQPV